MLPADHVDAPLTLAPGPAGGAALAFTEGARRGWLASDLAAWIQRHLLAPGYLRLGRPELGTIVVDETDAGRVVLPSVPQRHPDRRTTSTARSIVELARERVELALFTFLPPTRDDRFLHGAIYTGRVRRADSPHSLPWVPTLDEGGNLSQWVLALFAADALAERSRYDDALYVCDVCGSVGFRHSRSSRRRCDSHNVSPSVAPPRSASRIPVPKPR